MAVRRNGKYAYGYNAKYAKDRRPWKEKSRTDKRKKSLSYFLVFILSFITIVALLFNAVFISFFSNSKISKALCTNEMYTVIQTETKKNFESILEPYNIPISVLSNTLDNSYIYKDMKVFLGNSDGIFDKYDLGSRKEVIVNNLTDYYKSKNVKITSSLSKNINATADKLLESYTESINLPLWPRFLELRYSVSTYSFFVEFAIIAIITILIIRIKQVNRKYIHRFFRYMCEFSWTCSLSCLLGSMIVNSVHIDIGSQFEQKQYSLIFNSLTNDYVAALLIFSAFMLIIGIVFFIYSLKARKELIWMCSHKHLSPKDAEQFHNDIAKFIEDGGTAKHENNQTF